MPHKHKRREFDLNQFDLPPTVQAKPLPVRDGAPAPSTRPKNKRKRVENYGADDTPKAFARLMQFSATGKGRKGLDDGPKPKKKKQKVDASATATDTVDSEAQAPLKIKPGERLGDFAQRVNQALPLTGVGKKGKKVDGMSDHRVTKHEKKLKRLQAGWRKEEARIRDKAQEALELAEEDEEELKLMWEDKTVGQPTAGKKGKKAKRKKVVGEVDDGLDEWEALKAKREERKGLHDVVQAPPQFTRLPREVFKVKNGAKVQVMDVPNAVGSLRRREELDEARQGIIDTYRKLMDAKRGH